MGKDTVENTALRIRAVLEILAAEDPSSTVKISRGDVLEGAFARVPLEGRETETLSTGVTRGERGLVTATTKLAKAGWILKEGRSGWSITETGRKALLDFPDTESLLDAMNGKPAPAASAAAEHTEEVVEEAVRESVEVAAVPETHGASESADVPEPSFPQPGSVVLAGDLGSAVGAADWDPASEELSFTFDRHDELWKLTLDLPAGQYAYKVALDGSWDENYGHDAHRDGSNIEIQHDGGALTFLYDHATHAVVTKQDVSV